MSRYLRYLRIAFSITCLTACVLVVALWVRSFHWGDQLEFPVPATHGAVINSLKGRILIAIFGTGNSIVVKGTFVEHHDSPDYELGGTGGPFQVRSELSAFSLLIPHWFLIAISATLAAAPWTHKLKWRFSLSTLLIAITLLAAVLGFITVAAR